MKRLFSRLDPDFIGAQEVTDRWKAYFEEDLPGFGTVFAFRGKLDHEGTPIYYRRDRFDLVESGRFWLSETPEKESRAKGSAYLRIACWGIFERKEDGRRLLFINTHLDCKSERARILGARIIADFIGDKGAGLPAVLTGDMNDVSYSEAIETLREKMTDARLSAPVTCETNTHMSEFGSPADASIDYILLKDARAARYSVEKECDGNFPQSDHYAVVADIEL